jgi:hypothetical protein
MKLKDKRNVELNNQLKIDAAAKAERPACEDKSIKHEQMPRNVVLTKTVNYKASADIRPPRLHG